MVLEISSSSLIDGTGTYIDGGNFIHCSFSVWTSYGDFLFGN